MRLSAPSFVVAIVVLLLGMVALNVADRRFTPKTAEEEAAEQAQKSEPSESAPPAPSALVGLPPEQITGPPNAQTEIVFGWEWTPEVQADPGRLYRAIEALQKAAGQTDIKLRVVNVDAVPGAPRGLSVNGKTVLELPANGLLEPPQLMRSVSGVLSQHSH